MEWLRARPVAIVRLTTQVRVPVAACSAIRSLNHQVQPMHGTRRRSGVVASNDFRTIRVRKSRSSQRAILSSFSWSENRQAGHTPSARLTRCQ